MYRVNFLDLPLDLFDLSMIESVEPGVKIFSLNAEQVALADENPEYKSVLKNFDLIIPDGSSVVLALKFLVDKNTYREKIIFREKISKIRSNDLDFDQNFHSHENFDQELNPENTCTSSNMSDFKKITSQVKKIAGVDLAKKFIESKKRVAILGTTDDVIEKMREIYGKKLVFAHNGYFSEDKESFLVSQIVDSSPEILLVAMGAPKQEKFILKYQNEFKNFISMGVGGSLEVLSGKRSRAPEFLINLHLEWLWRLILEPFRINRILSRVPRFIFIVLKYKSKRV